MQRSGLARTKSLWMLEKTSSRKKTLAGNKEATTFQNLAKREEDPSVRLEQTKSQP